MLNQLKLIDVSNSIWSQRRSQIMSDENEAVYYDRRDETYGSLIVSWDVGCNWYGFNKDGNTPSPYEEKSYRETWRILYTKAGYTNVYMARGETFAPLTPNNWEFITSHDSCWTDFDDHLYDYANEAREKVLSHIPEAERWEGMERWYVHPDTSFILSARVKVDFREKKILELKGV